MLNICTILDVVWKLEAELNDIASCTISQRDAMQTVCRSAHTMRKNRRRVKTKALLTVRLPNSNSHLAHSRNLRPKHPHPSHTRRTVYVAALAMAAKAKAATPVANFILWDREKEESRKRRADLTLRERRARLNR